MRPSTNLDAIKRKGIGGLLATIGFLLSPLSWWNDLVVNVPLALAFAWGVSLFAPRTFTASFIVGYWLTNILGFVLMHQGAAMTFSDKPKVYGRKQIAWDLAIALFYTALIVCLVKLNVVGPLPASLFPR